MRGNAFKIVTTAALIGLVVTHANSFAVLMSKVTGTFRGAVRLA